VKSAFRRCGKTGSDVVQTFKSARYGRPEGLHYGGFFHKLFRRTVAICLACAATACSRAANDQAPAPPPPPASTRPCVLPDLTRMEPSVQQQMREAQALLEKASPLAPGSAANGGGSSTASGIELAHASGAVGNLLLAAQYIDAAEGCYLNAQALAPTEARWPYYLGHVYKTRGDLAAAAQSFERVLALQPEDVATLVWLGHVRLDQGRPEDAEPLFARALARQPRTVAALVGQGRAALARREYARAADSLEQALSIDPRASMARYPLALAYRGMGNIDRAETHLRQRGGVEIGPPDPLMQALTSLLRSAVAYENSGVRALEGGDAVTAAAAFRKGLELAPDSPSLHHRLGTALSLSGDGQAAFEQFQEAARLAPGYAPAQFSLGVVLASAGRQAEAIERFSAAVRNDPGYVAAHLQLAELLQRTGRPDASLPHYARVIASDPRAAAARFGYAMALIRLQRFAEARARLTEGMKLHPERPEFGQALERLKTVASSGR
jgi:tetratricopeptide (TPR) repeat protein